MLAICLAACKNELLIKQFAPTELRKGNNIYSYKHFTPTEFPKVLSGLAVCSDNQHR